VVFIPVRCDRCYDRSGHLNIIRRQAPDVPPSRWLGGGRVGVLAPLYESSLEAATGATRIPNVQTNKADIIISTLSVTPDRARSLEHAGFRCREEAAGGERARVPSSVEELNRGSKVHGNLPAHPALGWMTERAIRHDEHRTRRTSDAGQRPTGATHRDPRLRVSLDRRSG